MPAPVRKGYRSPFDVSPRGVPEENYFESYRGVPPEARDMVYDDSQYYTPYGQIDGRPRGMLGLGFAPNAGAAVNNERRVASPDQMDSDMMPWVLAEMRRRLRGI